MLLCLSDMLADALQACNPLHSFLVQTGSALGGLTCSVEMTRSFSSWLFAVQVGNFAIWINNDTDYAVNMGRVADYIRSATGRLPYIIWRDASVQHFEVLTLNLSLAPSVLRLLLVLKVRKEQS